MTEQKGEALAAWLTRIWRPETDGATQEDWLPQWEILDRSFTYSAQVAPNIWLTYAAGHIPENDIIFLLRREDGKCTGHLTCFIQQAIVKSVKPEASEDKSLSRQFAQKWLPYFRRGCWLSGCDIESTTRERTEWMRPFTREEVEVWNLKMRGWEVGREALRVAAAFGVKTFEREELRAYGAIHENRVVCHYKGLAGTVLIEWVLDKRSGRLESVEIGAYGGCYLMRLSHNKWRYRAHAVFSQQLVRGLYSLNFDELEALQQLPQLTEHEQLECRLTLPREFWPLKWLEEEAEPLVVKWARIWSSLAPFATELDAHAARFVAPLSQDIELRVDVSGHVGDVSGCFLFYALKEIGSDSAILCCDQTGTPASFLPHLWGEPPTESLLHRQSEWMDFFRRGCWLSGCDIEASAHEKMEWMRGFTREELEAWKLKM